MNYNTTKSFTSSGRTLIWLHLILTSGKPLREFSVAWLVCYELNSEAPLKTSNNQNKQIKLPFKVTASSYLGGETDSKNNP